MPALTRRQLAWLTLAPLATLLARCTPAPPPPTVTPTPTVPPATPRPGGPPNVILIITDDLDSRAVTAMPNTQSLLAAQGVRCSRYFVTTPLCAPSRSSIFRGQYAHNHGVTTNTGDTGGFPAFHRLGLESSTIATWLHDAGYRTGLFGKYLNRYPKGAHKSWVPPGWDAWAALLDSAGNYYTDFSLNEDGEVVAYSADNGNYLTDVLSDKAVAFVRDSAATGGPFFAYIAPYAPHSPSTPAPRDVDAFDEASAPRVPSFNETDIADKPDWVRSQPLLTAEQIGKIDERERQRLRSLRSVDDLVVNLVSALNETGQLDQTYLLFTSDNGFQLGEHRLPLGKQTAYEESIGVPLIVRGPGIPAESVVDAITLNIDLAPTIAEWCDIETPAYVDGLSLAPLLGGAPSSGWRHVALIEEFNAVKKSGTATPGAATPAPEEESDEADSGEISPAEPPSYHALRGDDLLYVEYDDGQRELYDLAADPFELTNIVDRTAPDRLLRLSATLETLSTCKAASCRAIRDLAGSGGPSATPVIARATAVAGIASG
jgi:N-acetylglucosamine-6-sulfatase